MLISKRSLILGAGAAFITRPSLALPSAACRGPFNSRKIGPVNPNCLVVPNGLVGYWPLAADTTDFHQGITFDISGNNNTGTLHGNPSITIGPIDTAMVFNMPNQYYAVPAINAPKFSFVFWTNTNSSGSNILPLVTNRAVTGGTVNGFILYIDTYQTSDRKLVFECGNGSSQYNLYSLVGAIINNIWQFIAATYDGVNCYLYINGNISTSGSPGISFNANSILYFFYYTYQFYYNGNVSNIAMYNRALAPWEVQTLYQAGLSGSRTPLQKAI